MSGASIDEPAVASRPGRRPRQRPRLVGLSAGGPLTGIARDILSARTTLVSAAGALDAAGAIYPAAYARSACGNADRALAAIGVLSERERGARDTPPPGVEAVTTTLGLPTGVWAERMAEGAGSRRGRLDASRRFVADPAADQQVTTTEGPDLAWTLTRSDDAAALAAGDVAAGLLVRALCRNSWLHAASRVRWSGSRDCAALVVRLLRQGRSAPDLADGPFPHLVDEGVSAMIGGLGWFRHEPTSRIPGEDTYH